MQEAKASIWRKIACFYGLTIKLRHYRGRAQLYALERRGSIGALRPHSSHSLDPLAALVDVKPRMMLDEPFATFLAMDPTRDCSENFRLDEMKKLW